MLPKVGDNLIVTSGKLKGASGTIERLSTSVTGGYVVKLTSLKPAEIKIFLPSQFQIKP